MNEESLQRAGHELNERPRSTLPLRLVGKDGEHAAATEPVESVPGTTYALARLNVITLDSAREQPEQELLDTEFSFAQCDVGSVVIHTCMTGNDRQSAHGWLFKSPEPDLFCERPVAEIAVSSAGVSSVTPGCPSDYDAVKVRVFPVPVAAATRSRTRRARTLVLIALAVTFIAPWIALMLVADRTVPTERAVASSFAVTPWVATSAVDLPLPVVLPTPAPPPQAAEEVVVKSAKPRPVPAPVKKPVTRVAQEKPRPPIERAAEPPKLVQGASRTEAPISQPPRVVLTQRARPVVETGAQRLAREQALCDERNFVGRALCREGARWRHCHPEKWDVAAECMVKADTMQ